MNEDIDTEEWFKKEYDKLSSEHKEIVDGWLKTTEQYRMRETVLNFAKERQKDGDNFLDLLDYSMLEWDM